MYIKPNKKAVLTGAHQKQAGIIPPKKVIELAVEPWLLATNLPAELFKPKRVVSLYAKRMQIEESFRDLKSPQYGMGLRHSKSRCPNRLDILLLLSLLATIIPGGSACMLSTQIGNESSRQIQSESVLCCRLLGLVKRLGGEAIML
nr:transposase [Pseudoalteromonas rubra]